jgi:uncharacterized protein YndB with AHSA1/START domain
MPEPAMPHSTVTQSIEIAASRDRVWQALTDRDMGRVWRSADYETDWQPGSAIAITAQIGPKRYRDKGTVLAVERPNRLTYEFLPRVSGLPYIPESYSVVSFLLEAKGEDTELTVTHTVPPSPVRRGKNFEIGPESGEKHVMFYWRSTLPLLRDMIEGRDSLALRMARMGLAGT